MNDKIKAIAEHSSQNLRALIMEAAGKILEAWHSAAAEAQLQEKDCKLRLGYAITLDLDNNSATYDLSWSVRHTLSATSVIPDPDQQTLPLDGMDGVAVEIRACDTTTGKIPFRKLREVAEKLKEGAS